MRRFYMMKSEKLGMTVRQFLAAHTSAEITELLVMETLPTWEEKFLKEQQAKNATGLATVKSQKSREIIQALFGHQIRKGEVVWQREKGESPK